MQLEADDRSRYVVILGELQLVLIDCVHSEDAVMGLVALRRARTAVAVGAEVGAALDGALRHQPLLHVACVLRDRGGRSRDVEYDPMPETAAGRCVGIVDSNGETFGVARCSAPAQRWGNIAAIAAE